MKKGIPTFLKFFKGNLFFSTIRRRFLFLIFAVLGSVFLVQTSIYLNEFSRQRAQELQANLELARAVGENFESFVKDILRQEKTLGASITFSRLSRNDIASLLEIAKSQYPGVQDFSWVSPEGRILASSKDNLVGTKIDDRPSFQDIMAGKPWSISNLIRSETLRTPFFTVSCGIFDAKDGGLTGVVDAMIVPDLLDMMTSIVRSGEGTVIVIDGKGVAVFSHPHIDWSWEKRYLLNDYPILEQVFQHREIATIIRAKDGKRYIAALSPILQVPGWIAGAGRPEAVVMAPLVHNLINHVGMILAVTIAAFLLALWISSKITLPVKEMRDHVFRFSRGEYDTNIRAQGPAELKELAEVFNLMAKEIQNRQKALQNAHDKMEERVQERTDELARANESLRNEVAERRRIEDDLKGYTEKLEISNRDLQDFAFVASHDLQEPLRKIMVFGNLIITHYERQLDNKGLDYLQRMRSAAERMKKLLNALLNYSRVATMGQPFVPVDLTDIAHEALIYLGVLIEETQGTVTIGELPVVEADPDQMLQLFQNLIGNALKFHRKGVPPEIEIVGDILDFEIEEKRTIRCSQIHFSDNGIGFDPKFIDRIFSPFQRLHRRDQFEGTGMGLAICRRIAERHQGRITADSAPGEGSVFTVILPIEHDREKCDTQ